MAKVNHITHKKSAVADNAPKATDIVNGEIAVNYAKDTERMYIKNASDEARRTLAVFLLGSLT